MKKNVLKSSFLAGLCALIAGLSGIKDSKLTDITKPYLGEYECKNATFGGVDYLKNYRYIRLELKADETFVVSYREQNGMPKTVEGNYQYNKEKQTICFQTGEGIKREFPLEKGTLYVTTSLAQKTLRIVFEQK